MPFMSPLKNHVGKKSGNIYNHVNIASLKSIMRNLIGKTHTGKRVQCDVWCHVILRGNFP
jgi:hypothetical protein